MDEASEALQDSIFYAHVSSLGQELRVLADFGRDVDTVDIENITYELNKIFDTLKDSLIDLDIVLTNIRVIKADKDYITISFGKKDVARRIAAVLICSFDLELYWGGILLIARRSLH